MLSSRQFFKVLASVVLPFTVLGFWYLPLLTLRKPYLAPPVLLLDRAISGSFETCWSVLNTTWIDRARTGFRAKSVLRKKPLDAIVG